MTPQSPAAALLPLRISIGDRLELYHLGQNIKGLLPYQHLKNLGSGGHAIVDMVKDTNTGAVYARKTAVKIGLWNLRKAKEQLHNEIEIMQRLSTHHHFVKLRLLCWEES
jgi:serine/threonine protein kinase